MGHFNVEREFFIIESTHLESVNTNLYGFTFVDNKVVEDISELGEETPKGDGAYVFIKRQENKITITQDFMGSYGLYVFQDDGYFALSNSFMRLLDYLKNTYNLTLNKAYSDSFIVSSLCSISYGETLVNEIKALDRCAVVEIDLFSKTFVCNYIDYEENSIDLSTEKGLQVLDGWYQKWVKLIKHLYHSGKRIRCDLSGGFDSRITFALFLGANIDLNEIYVCSLHDGLHTHTEDYEIATDISRYYGFELNHQSVFAGTPNSLSMDEILNLSFYLKLGFHKQMYLKLSEYEDKRAYFSGSGGECVRSYWNTSKEQFIEKELIRCKKIMGSRSRAYEKIVEDVLCASFKGIEEKFKRFGRCIDDDDLTLNLYRETRCRNHFGKDLLENYYGGAVKYCPLLDRELHKLKLCDDRCSDKNLLMAVIFERYQPQLLNFRFEGGRSIRPETIAYAREINERYPVDSRLCNEVKCTVSRGIPEPAQTKQTQFMVSMNEAEAYIKKAFFSNEMKHSFLYVYPEELYEFMSMDIETRKYKPLEYAVTGLAISKVIADIKKEHSSSIYISEYIRKCVSSGMAKPKHILRIRIQALHGFNKCLQTLKHHTPAWIKEIYHRLPKN